VYDQENQVPAELTEVFANDPADRHPWKAKTRAGYLKTLIQYMKLRTSS